MDFARPLKMKSLTIRNMYLANTKYLQIKRDGVVVSSHTINSAKEYEKLVIPKENWDYGTRYELVYTGGTGWSAGVLLLDSNVSIDAVY